MSSISAKVAEPSPAGPDEPVAVLEHLSGPSVGLETFLYSEQLVVLLGEDRRVSIKANRISRGPVPGARPIARLIRSEGTYQLKAESGEPVWINGRTVAVADLIDGDVIEFGEKGPLSRFRLIDKNAHERRYFTEICDDCWDYLRTSRRPMPARLGLAIAEMFRRVLSETTLLFRFGMVTALALLGYLTYQQYQINQMQQAELRSSQSRIEDFASTLDRTRQEALTPTDLEQLRQAVSRDLSSSINRLEALEKEVRASQTVVRSVSPSVVFLQGGYGFRETSSGRVLRHVLGPDGKPMRGPGGTPLLSLDGDGEPAERNFTGTAFAILDGRVLVTNRHVAMPWTSDNSGGGARNGLEPFTTRLIAYSAGLPKPREIELIGASQSDDLALLRLAAGEDPIPALTLAAGAPAGGSPVIVVGYPTGLRSMIARAGKAFVEELQAENMTGFWEVAARLAKRSLVRPLSSLGIVAQASDDYLVYDAATTRGGSGGPVVDLKGQVVAVNTAVLPEYGGSNLGVPAARLSALITELGLRPSAQLDTN